MSKVQISRTWLENDKAIQGILQQNFRQEQVERAVREEIPWEEVAEYTLKPNKNENNNRNVDLDELDEDDDNTDDPEPDPDEILIDIYKQWQENHVVKIREYNRRLYPIDINEFSKKLKNNDRDAWLTLFFLGATHTMGRTKHEQHRDFIQFCWGRDWWHTFSLANPRSLHREWMEVLNDYMESQLGDTEWYYWMEKFPTIYRIASYLDAYKQSFLAVDKIKISFNLHSIIAPRTNPVFQGGGADAPPLRLGIGANFIVRELVRLRVVEPTKHVKPHCFVPRANVRRLFTRLGCQGLNNPDFRHSIGMYDFLLKRFRELDLSAVPTFQNAFDIPFELYSENPKNYSRMNLSAFNVDIREDNDFNEEQES